MHPGSSSSLDVTSLRGSGVGRPEEAVDLSEPVAAAVDVGDVYVVQQAVRDRGGEDLVAGEDFGPVAHMLVGGEDDRALLVARAHQAEEEVGPLAVEGPEAHFVDDEQCAVQLALGLEPSGRDRRVSLEHVHEVIEEEVGGAEPVLDGLHAERHGEVALADAGRAHDEHVVGLAHEGARGQGLELRSVGRGLEGPVEALQGRADRQPAEPERGNDAPFVEELRLLS